MVLERQKNPSFVAVKCRCGRSLRAKWEQVETEIRCWDCQQLVWVPMPNPRARLANEMIGRSKATVQGPGLYRLALVAVIVAAALTIPTAGVAVAGLILVFLASALGETIRRGNVDPPDAAVSWRTLPHPRTFLEATSCLLMVAGTIVPLWVVHAAVQRSPHLDRTTALVLGSTWLVMPLAMVMVYAREPGRRSGWRRFLAILRRHFWGLVIAVLIVPVGFCLTEGLLAFCFYLQGALPFFSMEYMPIPGNPAIYVGVPHYDSRDFRLLPQDPFIRSYFHNLAKGYSLIGAIPPSLSLSTRAGLSPAIIALVPWSYAALRFLLVVAIVTCLLAAFSIQSRWLGLLAFLEKSRLEQVRAGDPPPQAS